MQPGIGMYSAGLLYAYSQSCRAREHVGLEDRDADFDRAVEIQASSSHTLRQGFHQLDVAVISQPTNNRHHIFITDDTIEIIAMPDGFHFQFDVDQDALHAAALVLMNADEALQFKPLDEERARFNHEPVRPERGAASRGADLRQARSSAR